MCQQTRVETVVDYWQRWVRGPAVIGDLRWTAHADGEISDRAGAGLRHARGDCPSAARSRLFRLTDTCKGGERGLGWARVLSAGEDAARG